MWSLFRRDARQAKPARRTQHSVRPRLAALQDRCLLSAPGSIDATFSSGSIITTSFGTRSNDYAAAIAVQPDGNIVAGRIAYNSSGQPSASGTYTLYSQTQDNYGVLSDPDSLALTVS